MFSDQSSVNWTEPVHGTSRFLILLSPIVSVWNMSENFHYESVYFKKVHNDQEYYWRQYTERGQLLNDFDVPRRIACEQAFDRAGN